MKYNILGFATFVANSWTNYFSSSDELAVTDER